MKHNARNYTSQQWYMWYVQDECGADLFKQELKSKPMPSDTLIQDIAKFFEEYPYAPENVVVKNCTPVMAYNPRYVAPGSNRPPVEPEASPFWTDPACVDLPDGNASCVAFMFHAVCTLKMMICEWFVTWTPGKIPQHFKDTSSWPMPSSLSSSPAASASMQHYGPQPSTEPADV